MKRSFKGKAQEIASLEASCGEPMCVKNRLYNIELALYTAYLQGRRTMREHAIRVLYDLGRPADQNSDVRQRI